MKNYDINLLVATLAVAGLAGISGPAAAAIDTMDIGLDTLISGSAPGGAGNPWVNAKLLDLGFLGAPGVIPGFAAFSNTVELQITTTQGRDPLAGPAFTPAQLVAFGLSAYPDLAVVNGAGNLGSGDSVGTLYLNFNPSKDLSKMGLTWSGAPGYGFPASGVGNIEYLTSENGFDLGAAGKFDIAISFEAGSLGPDTTFNSKLVFHYNGEPGSDQNLDLSDFSYGSEGAGYLGGAGVFVGAPTSRVVAGMSILAGSPVPEPGTSAMLGAGLAGLGLVARRRKLRT